MVKREDVISIVFVPHKMAKQSPLTVACIDRDARRCMADEVA